MMKHVLAAVAIIGLIWAFQPERPAPVRPELTGVSAALSGASKADKARVSSFYDSMADVVKRSQLITTVEGFRRVHANSLDEAFKGTDLPGKYRGLDVAINATLVDAIGTDNTGLSEEKRAALVASLQKVAADAR